DSDPCARRGSARRTSHAAIATDGATRAAVRASSERNVGGSRHARGGAEHCAPRAELSCDLRVFGRAALFLPELAGLPTALPALPRGGAGRVAARVAAAPPLARRRDASADRPPAAASGPEPHHGPAAAAKELRAESDGDLRGPRPDRGRPRERALDRAPAG